MAKVLPVASVSGFLDHLEKSALLSADALSQTRATHASASDPVAVARELLKEGKLTKWQAGQLLHGFSQLTLGKYKLLDQLSSGDTGRVYLAEHVQLGRRMALKMLAKKLTAQPEVLKQFLEDSRRLAALEHRNLVHLFDVAEDDGRYYLVLENVEGKDLQQLVDGSGPTSIPQAVDFVRQMAQGLAYAHGQQMYHGSLKPTAVVVDPQGIVKVQDLGLGRLANPTPSISLTDSGDGAAAGYRAPEGVVGQGTVAGDIFSLGAMLVFLLTGKSPATASAAELLAKAQPTLAPAVLSLIEKLLATSPSGRPQSAGEVARSLADLASQGLEVTSTTSAKGAQSASDQDTVSEIMEVLPFDDLPAIELAKTKKPPVAKSLEEPASASSMAFSFDSLADSSDNSAASAMGPVVINSKRKAAAKPSAAAATSSAATPKGEDKGAKGTGKSNLPLILGASIGGGILALGACVGLVIYLMGGSAKPKKQEIAKAVTAPAEEKEKEASAKTSEKEKKPKAKPGVDANPNPNPNPSTVVPNPANPVVPPAVVPAVTPAVPVANPVVPAEVMPEKPAEPATPDPATPPPDPALIIFPPAAEKPASTPATPPSGAPDPSADPLAEFTPTFVSLPKMEIAGKANPDALKPLEIGVVRFNPKKELVVYLKGGEGAVAGKQVFTLKEGTKGELTKKDWELCLANDAASLSSALVIATLGIRDDKLVFQWTSEGLKQGNAPFICNCRLQLGAGKLQKTLGLREVLATPPLVIDLDKPLTIKWNIEYPPDIKRIVVEITAIDGANAKEFDKKNILEAAKDGTTVWMGNSDPERNFGMKLDCTMKGKTIQITGKTMVRLEGLAATGYSKKVIASLEPGLQAGTQKAEYDKKLAEELEKKGETKERGDQLKRMAEDNLKKIDAAKKQAGPLKDFLANIDANGRMHFKVMYRNGENTIELANTTAPVPENTKLGPAK